uniref:Putative secreted protein n=1 Tax=Ixodes ricinus TaxID=34613 RepID=A0A6B0U5H8_IXORI
MVNIYQLACALTALRLFARFWKPSQGGKVRYRQCVVRYKNYFLHAFLFQFFVSSISTIIRCIWIRSKRVSLYTFLETKIFFLVCRLKWPIRRP